MLIGVLVAVLPGACGGSKEGPGGTPDAGADGLEIAADAGADAEAVGPLLDPGEWGPHQVGTIVLDLVDEVRARQVRTVVWYPAQPAAEERATYLFFVEGRAFVDAAADPSAAPYPLVLFSHGFNGIAEQSVTLTEHLASHGYVVAAMDHEGNLIGDSGAEDEEVAQVALERPADVRYAGQQVARLAAEPGHRLEGLVDATRVALSGHSFGGYTALVAAGGVVDVDAARAACDAGVEADVFCPYIPYWPAGAQVGLDPPVENLKALFVLAPGGSQAFGAQGLTGIGVPTLFFGGSLDDMMPVAIELEPIYQALSGPKALGVIEGAGHLSFTNVCDIPIVARGLPEFCGIEGLRSPADTFATVNRLTTAFLHLHLKGLSAYAALLEPIRVAVDHPELTWSSEP